LSSRWTTNANGKNHKFHYEGGIVSFVTHLNKNKAAGQRKADLHARRERGHRRRIALQWNDGYTETIYTFANNINTHEVHPPFRVSFGV